MYKELYFEDPKSFFRAKKKKNKMMIVIMMIKVVQPLSQLPNEILDKIIDFALTGTDISIIITYNSLCQLDEPLMNSQCVTFVGYHE